MTCGCRDACGCELAVFKTDFGDIIEYVYDPCEPYSRPRQPYVFPDKAPAPSSHSPFIERPDGAIRRWMRRLRLGR